MADTIKTPLGEVNKKTAIIGGVAVAGIGFILYRRYQATQAASSATATTASTDDSTDDGSLDGEEVAAEDAGYYGSDLDTDGSDIIGYDSSGNPVYGTSSVGDSTSAYSTNADWTEAAVNVLAAEGVDTSTATTAIANVLAGLPVTTAQQNLFLQAVGLLGVNPPDGYPTPIRTTDTASTGTGGTSGNGSSGSTSSAPPSTTSSKTAVPAAVTGIHSVKATKNEIEYSWNASAGATFYDTYATYQGARVGYQRITSTTRTISGLTPDHTYTLHCIAGNASGTGSDSQTSVKTPKS